MQVEIKYVGYFDVPENHAEGRKYAPSAVTKMTYIMGVLNKIGYDVTIVSASQTSSRQGFRGRMIPLDGRNRLRLFRTFGRRGKLTALWRVVYSNVVLLAYLLVQVRRHEAVLVYHALAYQHVILLARRLKGFYLILEVEEIYQDVASVGALAGSMEHWLFASADAFVFSTELLHRKLNSEGRPYVVVYGTYENNERFKVSATGHREIRVVYAGILAHGKGAESAVRSALYLDERYSVHILGFGNCSEIDEILKVVEEVQSSTKCAVSFDGLLTGSQFSEFLGSCDIGLAPQDPFASFTDTSFPSKVLTYLSHGIKVVCAPIDSVRGSRVASAVTFYDEQKPDRIANAIREAVAGPDLTPGMLATLDREFCASLDELFRTQRVRR